MQNILFIHSDQHRYDCIAAHGLRKLQTPSLDRLVAEGASFSRAYSTIPICTPARASLLTGAWPTTHGAFSIPSSELNRAARRNLPTIFPILQSAGYFTAWIGKYHRELEAEEPGPDEGLDAFVPLGHYDTYCRRNAIPDPPRTHGLFGDENTLQSPEHTRLAWQADRAIELLDQGNARLAATGKPFMIRWDPPEPHLPCHPASVFASNYDAASIPPWPSFPDSLADKPRILARQRRIWGLEGWTWNDWSSRVRLYYGIITELDHHLGRILAHLERIGRTRDTVVIYSTDHGDFMGGHGLYDKHFCFYDDIARIPILIRAPGRIQPGTTCDAFASGSIDLARTLLAVAGLDAPPTFVGHDLVAMAADGQRPRSIAYAQYFGTESGAYSCRMIRDERYKFVWHPVGETDEFYDLLEDPGELRNRVSDPAYASEIRRLRARLWDEMKACGDRLACAWTEIELKQAPSVSQRAGL